MRKKPPIPAAAALVVAPVTFADLAPGHCRWPVDVGDEVRYCGAPKAAVIGPYCEAHTRRADGRHPGPGRPTVHPKQKETAP